MIKNYSLKYFEHQNNNSLLNKIQVFLKNNNFVRNDENFEYLFILGGDGTFLHFVNQYLNRNIKIIMINAGNVGFFSSCTIEELEKYIFESKYYQKLNILKIDIDKNSYYAINEITSFSFNAMAINLKLNNDDWYSFNGSGFIISTPLGSSGSNKSNFGPLVDPKINCFILSEILSINNSRFKTMNSPIVLDASNQLEITWDSSKNLQLSIDNKIISYNSPKIIINSQLSKASLLMVESIVKDKWRQSFIK